MRYPAEIRCPEELLLQWLCNAFLLASDWAKRGPGCPRRRFGHFFAVEKVTRVRAGWAREPRAETQFLQRSCVPARPAAGESSPLGQMRLRSVRKIGALQPAGGKNYPSRIGLPARRAASPSWTRARVAEKSSFVCSPVTMSLQATTPAATSSSPRNTT